MKTTICFMSIFVMLTFFGLNDAFSQWGFNGNDIYNTNSGNVGIGTSFPPKLLSVGKNMTEPTVLIRNVGGNGGATFEMIDDNSGADWKFKATLSGGFKIRDHQYGNDVIVVEPNGMANSLYIHANGHLGIGTTTPQANLEIRGGGTDEGTKIQLGNSDLSHRLTLWSGRENDPNPFILWKTGDPLRFATDEGEFNFSEKMRITSEGRVGIGTTNPQAALEVMGDGSEWYKGFMILANTDHDAGIRLCDGEFDVKFHIYNNNGIGDKLRIAPEGNYGSGGITILQTGDVGIGVISPASKLEVAGTVHSNSGGFKFPDGTIQTTAASVPPGVIVMWSGLLANIPTGWALCDGTGGTPDLRDRFIYGTSAGQDPGTTGGSASHSHSVNPPPASTAPTTSPPLLITEIPPVVLAPSIDHTHEVDISTFASGTSSTLPPYYKLAFIMKL